MVHSVSLVLKRAKSPGAKSATAARCGVLVFVFLGDFVLVKGVGIALAGVFTSGFSWFLVISHRVMMLRCCSSLDLDPEPLPLSGSPGSVYWKMKYHL